MRVKLLLFNIITTVIILTMMVDNTHAQQNLTERLMGVWTGTGKLQGKPVIYTITWQKKLSKHFIELSYNQKDSVSTFQAEAIYEAAESNNWKGYWYDNQGSVFQLTGVINENSFVSYWSKDGQKQGKSAYVFLTDDEIMLTEYQFRDGKYQSFAEVKIKRFAGHNAQSPGPVTGIGGIFFRANDIEKSQEWYRKHLGIDGGEHGVSFSWREMDNHSKVGYTVWHMYGKNDEYFQQGNSKPFMINYRVEDLDTLLLKLKKEGINQVGETETYSYGKFAWIFDPDGNKIELWEPSDP